MVSSRSWTKDKMVVSKEISHYFTKLPEPLVITQRSEEIFNNLKMKSLKDLKENLLHRIKK